MVMLNLLKVVGKWDVVINLIGIVKFVNSLEIG